MDERETKRHSDREQRESRLERQRTREPDFAGRPDELEADPEPERPGYDAGEQPPGERSGVSPEREEFFAEPPTDVGRTDGEAMDEAGYGTEQERTHRPVGTGSEEPEPPEEE